MIKIMNANHLIEFSLSDLETSQAFECFFEVCYCDEICVINIELFEQHPQLFIVEFLVNSKCGSDELRIVNHPIAIVVNFTDNLLYLCVIVSQVKLLERGC